MSSPAILVPSEVYSKAQKLISINSTGASIKDGIELLLQNDITNDGGSSASKTDAGALLKNGLTKLATNPFDALGVPLGSKTVDIRKAYKKMALKYHPDKNPKTTALFQVIQTAADKLTDRDKRGIEESKQKNVKPTTTSAASYDAPKPPSNKQPTPAPTAPSYSSASTQQKKTESTNAYNNYANKAKADPRDKMKEDERIWRENLDKARKYREEAIKEGQKAYQKAYLDEQERLRELSKEKERQREETRKAMYGNKNPTPTPDQAPLRGFKDNRYNSNDPHINQAFQNVNNAFNKMNVGGAGVGVKFTLNSDGSVRQHNNSNNARPFPSQNGYKRYIPIPTSLRRGAEVLPTSVELEWNIPHHGNVVTLGYELSWRQFHNNNVFLPWETSPKLISNALKCKKKNLIPSTLYEFRIRSVLIFIDGTYGDKSEWSNTLSMTTPSGADEPKVSPRPQINAKMNTPREEPKVSPRGPHTYVNNPVKEEPKVSPRGPQLNSKYPVKEEPKVSPRGPQTYSSNPVKEEAKVSPRGPQVYAKNNQPYEVPRPTQPMNNDSSKQRTKLPSNPLRKRDDDEVSSDEDVDILGVSARNAWMKNNNIHIKEDEIDDDVPASVLYKRSFSKPAKGEELDEIESDDEVNVAQSNNKFNNKFSVQTNGDKGKLLDDEDLEDWYELKPPVTDLYNYQHPVYKDPAMSAKIIGHLIVGMTVLASRIQTSNKEWLRVKYHRGVSGMGVVTDWGWSKIRDDKQVYLSKTSEFIDDDYDDDDDDDDDDWLVHSSNNTKAPSQGHGRGVTIPGLTSVNSNNPGGAAANKPFGSFKSVVDTWRMYVDPKTNCPYYVNENTGESSWTCPEWIEEVDPTSGVNYYVKLDSANAQVLKSTWSKPDVFARLIKEDNASVYDEADAYDFSEEL